MKVILVNGSPHEHGCTATALEEVEKELVAAGVETEIFWLGPKPIAGCYGCAKCLSAEAGSRCYIDDVVNTFLDKAVKADGFIFGSPVHYAAASGAITSFMDRAFYGKGKIFRYKPAAAIVSCRRGGSTAALDQLNKYFALATMPVVSSKYWNMVHGNTPDEVRQDLEGLQTMRELGRNMAWMLKCFEAGRKAGIEPPKKEIPVKTNFIR